MCLNKWKKLHPGKDDCFANKTSVSENGKTFRIECKDKAEQFCCIHADGCFIIDNDSKKCDYIFIRCTNEDTYYVELKGQEIDRAYEQLISTIDHHFRIEKVAIHGFIVTGKGIPRADAKRKKIEEAFYKKYRTFLKIEKSPCIHKI